MAKNKTRLFNEIEISDDDFTEEELALMYGRVGPTPGTEELERDWPEHEGSGINMDLVNDQIEHELEISGTFG